MLNLKIVFLQMAVGGSGVAFLGYFGIFCMFICIMCHFCRSSVLCHGKCGIKSKLLTIGVHSCVVSVVSVVATTTAVKN